jgi:hypothetical protein
MKVGDSVKIKKKVTNTYIYNAEYSLGGYEGHIFSIFKNLGRVIVEIEFDSISLKAMPDDYIKELIAEDTDYGCIDLELKDVSISKPRDTPEDVIAARKEIAEKHDYVSIIDEGEFKIWEKHPGDEKDSSEIEQEPEDNNDELWIRVSLCRVKGLKKAMSMMKRKKMITRKRTRKRKK